MVKSYHRYVAEDRWGLVASSLGRVATVGERALTPALEAAQLWSLRHGGLIHSFCGPPALSTEVSALCLSPDRSLLGLGHADGTVRLWEIEEAAERVTLSGHRGSVLCLAFSVDGSLLSSGGADTLLVLWDVVAEAGRCKLRGHRGAVTGVAILSESLHALASVSKDGTLRLWDLHTQHCVQTVGVPSGELWAIWADEGAGTLLTGGAGGELLLWSVERAPVDIGQRAADDEDTGAGEAAAAPPLRGVPVGEESIWVAARASLCGALPTSASSRVAQIEASEDGSLVGVLYADKTMGIWRVRDGSERLRRASKRRAERARKRKKRGKGEPEPADEMEEEEDVEGSGGVTGAEEALAAFEPICGLRGTHKLHSFSFLGRALRGAAKVQLLVVQRDNSAAVWEVDVKARTAAPVEGGCATPAGHRAEPRALAMSGDDAMVASASDGEARVWSMNSRQCIRTVRCGYGLSIAFMGGNRFLLVGTKAGALQLFELATGELVCEETEAHTGAVWALDVAQSGALAVSASADKTISTWQMADGRLVREQSIELGDDAMCSAFTPDGAKVIVGMLDASVKLIDLDSEKTHLTLYGHKLPVLGVGASSDGQIAASVSADKSLKLWGLDFGDLHRSLYAHTEPVTSLAWVPRTHYLFTCGKDGLIKYWDADAFVLIHMLRGHHSQIWSVVASRSGAHLVSASRDRSLRLWTRSEEQVFLEEEREAEVEAVLDASIEKQQQAAEAEEEEAAALGVDGRAGGESGAAGRRTLESVKGAERVLEALKTLDEEDERVREFEVALAAWRTAPGSRPQPTLAPNLLLLNLSPGAYLLRALSSVRSAELEQALLLLPFESVRGLLRRLLPLLPVEAPIELMARCVLYVVRVHHKAIVANRSFVELLQPIAAALHSRVARERATLGYNVAALGFLRRIVERDGGGRFFEGATAGPGDGHASIAELRRRTAAQEKAGVRGKKNSRRSVGAAS